MKSRLVPFELPITNPNFATPPRRITLRRHVASKVLFGGLIIFFSLLFLSLAKAGPGPGPAVLPGGFGPGPGSSARIERSRTTMVGTRRLTRFSDEEKKAALRRLEDVLLEPPRSASGKSRTYVKKTKFLPDLLNDSLEGYPRRVFIDVGEIDGANGTKWFEENYPRRNQDFEVYRIETMPETQTELDEIEVWGPPGQMEMSDWLRRNVREEEFVVMKAEAEVVEEMAKAKEGIELVDELFLECKPKGKGLSTNKRAYWECLALYGRLRDLGVAVHQWWG